VRIATNDETDEGMGCHADVIGVCSNSVLCHESQLGCANGNGPAKGKMVGEMRLNAYGTNYDGDSGKIAGVPRSPAATLRVQQEAKDS
jgi:hypothetical protein